MRHAERSFVELLNFDEVSLKACLRFNADFLAQ
jgi:hypothetical protein